MPAADGCRVVGGACLEHDRPVFRLKEIDRAIDPVGFEAGQNFRDPRVGHAAKSQYLHGRIERDGALSGGFGNDPSG